MQHTYIPNRWRPYRNQEGGKVDLFSVMALTFLFAVYFNGVVFAAQDAYDIPQISKDAISKASNEVMAKPDIPYSMKEDIFRLEVVDMNWDIGVMVYTPEDAALIAKGPEGRKAGIFLLHGGSGDWRDVEPLAKLLVSKFGFKVTSMTYPGRLYLPEPSRNWPGDTITPGNMVNPLTVVRTPIWAKGAIITPDQYVVVLDNSKRERYGTLVMTRALEGTEFYDRMASWPPSTDIWRRKKGCRSVPPLQ